MTHKRDAPRPELPAESYPSGGVLVLVVVVVMVAEALPLLLMLLLLLLLLPRME